MNEVDSRERTHAEIKALRGLCAKHGFQMVTDAGVIIAVVENDDGTATAARKIWA